MWIIGDHFLHEIFPSMQALKTQSTTVAASNSSKITRPFLYKYYNLLPFYPSPGNLTRSTPARFFNQLIQGPNDKTELPKYIILVPDIDLIWMPIKINLVRHAYLRTLSYGWQKILNHHLIFAKMTLEVREWVHYSLVMSHA